MTARAVVAETWAFLKIVAYAWGVALLATLALAVILSPMYVAFWLLGMLG